MNIDEFLRFWQVLQEEFKHQYKEDLIGADDLLALYGHRSEIHGKARSRMSYLLPLLHVNPDVISYVNDRIGWVEPPKSFQKGSIDSIDDFDQVLDQVYKDWSRDIIQSEGAESLKERISSVEKKVDNIRVEKKKIKQAKEEEQKADEEQMRQLKEDAERTEKRREEQRKRDEEAQRKKEEEEQRKREEDEQRMMEEEEQRKRDADAKRRKEEEEKRKKAEEEQRKREEDEKRKKEEEEERKRVEEAERKREEDARRQKIEAEAQQKKEEEERIRKEQEKAERAEKERLEENFNRKVEGRRIKEVSHEEIISKAGKLKDIVSQEEDRLKGVKDVDAFDEKFIEELYKPLDGFLSYENKSDLDYGIEMLGDICDVAYAGKVPSKLSEEELNLKANQVFDFLQEILDGGNYNNLSRKYSEFTKKRAESLDKETIDAIKAEIEEEEKKQQLLSEEQKKKEEEKKKLEAQYEAEQKKKEEKTEEKVEEKTEEIKAEEKAEEKKAEEIKPEEKTEEKVEEKKVEEIKPEEKTEEKVEEKKVEDNQPKREKLDPAEVRRNMLRKLKGKKVKTEVKTEVVNEEANKEVVNEEVNKEVQKEEVPKEEDNKEVQKEEVNKEVPKEEVNKEVPKEEVNKEVQKEEVNKEVPKEEVPKEEDNKEVPKEEVNKEVQNEEVNKEVPKEEANEEPQKEEVNKKKLKEVDPEEAARINRSMQLREAIADFDAISGKELNWFTTSANADTFQKIKDAAGDYDNPIVPGNNKEKRKELYQACDEYLRAHTTDGKTIDGQRSKVGRLRKQAVVAILQALEQYPDIQEVKAEMEREAAQKAIERGEEPARVKLNFKELEKSLAEGSKAKMKLKKEDKKNPDAVKRKAYAELKAEREKR